MTVGASAAVWDHEGWLASCTRQVQLVRDAGALAALPIHLTYLAMAIAWTGDFAGAASLVAEIDSVAAVTGTHFPPYALLRLRALQGREAEASAAIASAIERQFGRAGHDGGLRRIGRPRSCTTASPATTRRRRRPGEPPRTPSTIGYPHGCCPSSSRRPHAQGTPNSPAMPSSDWRRRRSPAAPIRARHRGALPGAAERRSGRRRAVSRGDRAAEAHPAPPGARPRAPPLWRVAAPRESPGRCARAAPRSTRDAGLDRDGGVR